MHPNKPFQISLPALAAFLFMMLTDRSGLCLVTLLAAFLHECGHLLAAKRLGIPLGAFRLDFLGARLDVRGRMLSYREEWLLAAAGPAASFGVAAMAALLWTWLPLAQTFSAASLLLGVLNLLPIATFDGGRMLDSALSSFFSERVAQNGMRLCSFFFLFLLWATAVYFLLRVGDGLSLLAFSMSLFFRFFEGDRL